MQSATFGVGAMAGESRLERGAGHVMIEDRKALDEFSFGTCLAHTAVAEKISKLFDRHVIAR
jgi:hypothetical protein